MIKDLGEDHQLQVVAEGLLIGSHFMQDSEPPSTGKLVHQFAEIARVAEADLLLATHHAYGIASHGSAKRRVRNLQMLSLRKDQTSIGLFDPQPGAMAGVNQELELEIFKGLLGSSLALAL